MDSLTSGAKGRLNPGPGMPGLPGPGAPVPPAQMPVFTPPPFPNGAAPGGGVPAGSAPGGGTPWYQNPQWWGLIGQTAGSLWGAYNQNQTNSANTAAQQAQLDAFNARQRQVTNYVNAFLQPGQNTYSNTILQMLGAQVAPQQQLQLPQQMPPVAGQGPAAQPGQTPIPAVGTPGWSIYNPALRRDLLPYGGPEMTPVSNPSLPPAGQMQVPQSPTDVTPSVPYNPPMIPIGQTPAQSGFGLPGFNAPQAILPESYQAQSIGLGDFAAGTPGFNAGQDSLMQMLRAGPDLGLANGGLQNIINGGGNNYDTSSLFNAIDASGQNALNQQVAQLQGSFGSFGSRLGSAAMNAQGQLRNNYLLGSNLQKQQIGQQAFNDAQARLMSALGLSSQNALSTYGSQLNAAQGLGNLGLGQGQLLAQLAQANQGAFNQAMQFNISNSLARQQANQSAGQNWNQFQLGALGQANAIQQAQSGQNINLLSLLAGLPMGQAPVAQPSALPGAIGDISQLALLYPYLRRS